MTRYVITERSDEFDFWDPVVDLPAMQPGDSLRVTMYDDGTFGVVRTVKFGMSPERDVLWVDAPEQENDR